MKRFIEAARLAAPTDYTGGEKAPYDWMHE
jgi:hypothetical protein